MRVTYCDWFNWTSGYMNSRNMRMWSGEISHYFQETPPHAEQKGVWVTVSRKRLYGPIYFLWRLMLQDLTDQLDPEKLECYFQHNDATAHTSQTTLNFFKNFMTTHLDHQIWRPWIICCFRRWETPSSNNLCIPSTTSRRLWTKQRFLFEYKTKNQFVPRGEGQHFQQLL